MSDVKMFHKEFFESEDGEIIIDVHHPIEKINKTGDTIVYGASVYYGRTNIQHKGLIQVFKFEITAKNLPQAIKKYEKSLEEALEEFQKQVTAEQNKIQVVNTTK